MTLSWVFIGMVIGLFAAERKKFNLLAGAVVGALLGPFSVLMFFASGPKMRVCPYCAEKVLPEARVCKHCHKDLPPVTPSNAASVGRAVALIVLAGGMTLACAGEPAAPSGSISSEAAQELILQRDEARDAAAAAERRFAAEREEMRREINDLRAQLGLAEETAAQASARAVQYEQGLGRAVEKLNEVAQAAAPTYAAAATPAPRYRAERVPTADVSYYSDPRVSIVDRSVAASGRLFNSGDAAAVGTLWIELLRDGVVVDTQQQQMQVNGNSWANWQAEFRITPSRANYSVQARLEY